LESEFHNSKNKTKQTKNKQTNKQTKLMRYQSINQSMTYQRQRPQPLQQRDWRSELKAFVADSWRVLGMREFASESLLCYCERAMGVEVLHEAKEQLSRSDSPAAFDHKKKKKKKTTNQTKNRTIEPK
jgi:hypothetical protein